MKKSTKLSAFTLIELLIVIAVIGILAGMLFPAIKAVMNSAQGTRVANNGKQIVTAITSANIDREQNFFHLMLRTGISTSMFAGGGVEAASDAADLKQKGNIWSMLAGIAVCDDNMPFIWTRNMDQLTDSDFNTSQDTETDWADKLNDAETPFGSQQVVLARKGASFQVIKTKDLTSTTFLASSTNGSVKVVKAIAGSAETGGEF